MQARFVDGKNEFTRGSLWVMVMWSAIFKSGSVQDIFPVDENKEGKKSMPPETKNSGYSFLRSGEIPKLLNTYIFPQSIFWLFYARTELFYYKTNVN